MFDACYSNSRIHWQGCKCIPYTFSETIKARDGTKPPDLNIGQVLQLKTWTGVSDIPCDLSTGKRHTLRFCRNWMFARWFFLIQLYWMLGLTPSDRWGEDHLCHPLMTFWIAPSWYSDWKNQPGFHGAWMGLGSRNCLGFVDLPRVGWFSILGRNGNAYPNIIHVGCVFYHMIP